MSDQTAAPQEQGQQIPMEDIFEIYGNDCLMLKINLKNISKAYQQLQTENEQLKQQIVDLQKTVDGVDSNA